MKETSRRRLLGTAAMSGIGATLLVTIPSESAKAEISVEDLEIDDKLHYSDGTPDSVDLVVNAQWVIESDYAVDKAVITLSVGKSEPEYEIDSIEIDPTDTSGSDELSGSITSSPDWSIHNFDRDNGEISYPATAELTLDVFNNDEIIASESVSDSFEMVVTGGEIEVNVSIAGSGNVEIS